MPDDAVTAFKPDRRSCVVALTHDPKLDDLALLEALQSEAFYVGAIGSRRNAEARRERMIEHFDQTEASLARLRGPIGIYIGSKTPPEIAVSVMAEILAVKNAVRLPRETEVARGQGGRGRREVISACGPRARRGRWCCGPWRAAFPSIRGLRLRAMEKAKKPPPEHKAHADGDQQSDEGSQPPGEAEDCDVGEEKEGAHGREGYQRRACGGCEIVHSRSFCGAAIRPRRRDCRRPSNAASSTGVSPCMACGRRPASAAGPA